MANNTWINTESYMPRSIHCETNGVWVVETYNVETRLGLRTNVRFACESETAPYAGRSMWGSVWNGQLNGLEDMDLVPAYVVAHARRMVRG